MPLLCALADPHHKFAIVVSTVLARLRVTGGVHHMPTVLQLLGNQFVNVLVSRLLWERQSTKICMLHTQSKVKRSSFSSTSLLLIFN